ncbi:MAG TPA: lipid II flippase MurJ [Thermomicrobiales bacterium]|nr:lipid II flippase MurJ [Thermomicrobiales bacterium]
MTDLGANVKRAPASLLARLPMSGANRRILSATVLVGALTLAVKLVTMGREVVVASKLGTGASIEAYIAAWAIPGFLTMITCDAIVGALLPLHAKARAVGGEEAGRRVFAESLVIALAVLGTLTLVLALIPGLLLPIFASNFPPEKLAMAERLWMIMLPAVALYGIGSIWSGMLNSSSRFGLAAISPMIVPLVSTIAMLAFPHHAVDALAIGFVLGSALQLGTLAIGMSRHGLGIRPAWYGGLPESRSMFRLAGPLIGNGIIFGGIPIVDSAMAASLGDHQLAILSYGTRLILPIMGISSAALATVVFPYFSRMVAEDRWDEVQGTIRTYTKLILAFSVPGSVLLMVFSHHIVAFLFERGAFNASDTEAVAQIQMILAMMIPFYALGVLYSRVVISLRKTHLMLLCSGVVFVVNVIADIVLKDLIGINGIAMATVINYALQLTLMWFITRKMLRQLSGPNLNLHAI